MPSGGSGSKAAALGQGCTRHRPRARPVSSQRSPATTDRATAEDWLDPAWGAAGIERGLVHCRGQP
ncbi:hypothetical protein [Streptomyces flaveus]|uniref:hypothetical protein n=1 Tax=Streptomyces flaveus TaxID=66370 RepID=UPI000AC127BB|nr:hypothetical protein [Streptomyces flaveus]